MWSLEPWLDTWPPATHVPVAEQLGANNSYARLMLEATPCMPQSPCTSHTPNLVWVLKAQSAHLPLHHSRAALEVEVDLFGGAGPAVQGERLAQVCGVDVAGRHSSVGISRQHAIEEASPSYPW